jgi:hypothetical protein
MRTVLVCLLLITSVMVAPVSAQEQTGDGVSVGVIDATFDLDADINGQDLATYTGGVKAFYQSCQSNGAGCEQFNDFKSHGTGVAELVLDRAPDSELYLTAVPKLSTQNFSGAVDYMINNDVDVVVASLGYWGAPYNGNGQVSQKVREAWDDGIIFVASAGNSAEQHWQGNPGSGVTDFDGDGKDLLNGQNDFQGDFTLYISEDDWTTDTTAQWEFRVVDKSSDTTIASETLNPTCDGVGENECEPWKVVSGSVESSEDPALIIEKVSSGQNISLEVFGRGVELEDPVKEGSLLAPATSTGVIAVGAYRTPQLNTNEPLEEFSSRGPTPDGRTGVDLIARNGQLTEAYESPGGSNRFFGTSAAAPEVAGVAALIHEKDPGATPAEVEQALQETADGDGVNTRVGHGKLNETVALNEGSVDVVGWSVNGSTFDATITNPEILRQNRELVVMFENESGIRKNVSLDGGENRSIIWDEAYRHYGTWNVTVGDITRETTLRSNNDNFNFTSTSPTQITVDNFDRGNSTFTGRVVFSGRISQGTGTTDIMIDGLDSGRQYKIYRDGSFYASDTAGVDGNITWTHRGDRSSHNYSVVAGSSSGVFGIPSQLAVSTQLFVGVSLFSMIGGFIILWRRRSGSMEWE